MGWEEGQDPSCLLSSCLSVSLQAFDWWYPKCGLRNHMHQIPSGCLFKKIKISWAPSHIY